MATIRIRLGMALLPALVLAGCASTTPQWDSHFGDSVRASLAAQVANPAAAAKLDPKLAEVAGLDGSAARAAMERYERSYAHPESAPAPALITTMGSKK